MKRILAALFLAFVGCQQNNPQPWTPPAPAPTPQPPTPPIPPQPPAPAPVPAPSTITETDNGKTFSVASGASLRISLTTNADPNYFWSFGTVSGDFEVAADNKNGGKQNFLVKCNQTGSFKLTYIQFTDTGATQLNEVIYGVQVK